jgi:dihydroorotase-like cyclic amidohydrolase
LPNGCAFRLVRPRSLHGLLNDFITLTLIDCQPSAELVKLDDKKGSIAVGKDADLVVWNPEEEFTVEESALYIQNKKTPYHGERLSGTVKRTFLRGQLIYETNEDCAPCAGPLGRLVVPSPASAMPSSAQ